MLTSLAPPLFILNAGLKASSAVGLQKGWKRWRKCKTSSLIMSSLEHFLSTPLRHSTVCRPSIATARWASWWWISACHAPRFFRSWDCTVWPASSCIHWESLYYSGTCFGSWRCLISRETRKSTQVFCLCVKMCEYGYNQGRGYTTWRRSVRSDLERAWMNSGTENLDTFSLIRDLISFPFWGGDLRKWDCGGLDTSNGYMYIQRISMSSDFW